MTTPQFSTSWDYDQSGSGIWRWIHDDAPVEHTDDSQFTQFATGSTITSTNFGFTLADIKDPFVFPEHDRHNGVSTPNAAAGDTLSGTLTRRNSRLPGRYNISAITITEAGAGYTSAPTVSIGTPDMGNGATATASINTGIATIAIGSGGTGYVTAPTITITAPVSGTTATATATVTAGIVTAITITEFGDGYAAAPTVTIAAPATRVTATATATITSGAVTALTVTEDGMGYITAPTVTIADPASGTTATATAQIADGTVTGLTITEAGTGYTSAPTVTITAPTTASTATATATYDGSVSGITVTDPGTGYESAPTVTITAAPSGGTDCEADAVVGGSLAHIVTATMDSTVTDVIYFDFASEYGPDSIIEFTGWYEPYDTAAYLQLSGLADNGIYITEQLEQDVTTTDSEITLEFEPFTLNGRHPQHGILELVGVDGTLITWIPGSMEVRPYNVNNEERQFQVQWTVEVDVSATTTTHWRATVFG